MRNKSNLILQAFDEKITELSKSKERQQQQLQSLKSNIPHKQVQVNPSEVLDGMEKLNNQIVGLLSIQVMEIAIIKSMKNAVDHINSIDTQFVEFIVQSNDRYIELSHRVQLMSSGHRSELQNAVT